MNYLPLILIAAATIIAGISYCIFAIKENDEEETFLPIIMNCIMGICFILLIVFSATISSNLAVPVILLIIGVIINAVKNGFSSASHRFLNKGFDVSPAINFIDFLGNIVIYISIITLSSFSIWALLFALIMACVQLLVVKVFKLELSKVQTFALMASSFASAAFFAQSLVPLAIYGFSVSFLLLAIAALSSIATHALSLVLKLKGNSKLLYPFIICNIITVVLISLAIFLF